MNPPAPTHSHSVLDQAKAAVAARRRPEALATLIEADNALLGSEWHPARHSLRAAEAALDIGRWDLAAARLDDVSAILSHPGSAPVCSPS